MSVCPPERPFESLEWSTLGYDPNKTPSSVKTVEELEKIVNSKVVKKIIKLDFDELEAYTKEYKILGKLFVAYYCKRYCEKIIVGSPDIVDYENFPNAITGEAGIKYSCRICNKELGRHAKELS